jgi:nitrogen fixation NifU-like protein
MSGFDELYQELILDHNRAPRNFRIVERSDHVAKGHNPLCGDRLQLFVRLDGDRIEDIGFQGDGCAISKASASLMTEAVKGRSRAEAEALFRHFHHMVADEPLPAGTPDVDMGKLEAFAGVGAYPARVKCATLAWHTLHAALAGGADQPIKTE